MKRINKALLSFIIFLLFISRVEAASASLTTSSSSVYVGDSFTVSVTVNSAAAWNIHVNSSGPVSGCTINQADATVNALDTTKSFNVTCTATDTGTITITLSGDVTSAEDGNAVNVAGTKTVTVNTKPTQPKNNTDTRSNNNKLKTISVDNYELIKENDHTYTLTIPGDVDSIYVRATADHSKAKVTGIGKHSLYIGENIIDVVITAENGAKNTIKLKVTRKDGNTIEDLSNALAQDSSSVDIKLGIDTVVSSGDLEKIKNSKKIVNLNYYDNEKILYSWIIDGTKINSSDSFNSGLSFSLKSKKEISKISNYADGMVIELSQKNNLPVGAKLKIYVANKFEDSDLVNVYSYNASEEKLELLKANNAVQNGYLTFDIDTNSNYLLTMSTIPNNGIEKQNDTTDVIVSNENNCLPKATNSKTIIYAIVGTIIGGIIVLIAVIIKKKKDSKKTETVSNSTVEQIPSIETQPDSLV